ncbi:HEAT repeat domain-containing protein [Streptomyces sp. NPDC041068]|uniref:HEAT repeat domain-containing protein n=1 Tax=Streptomyces sp. NPDC041068 TaxID=3155130 RepID=UPI0033F00C04
MITGVEDAQRTLGSESSPESYIEALLYLYRLGPEADDTVMGFIRRMGRAHGKEHDVVSHGTAIRIAAEFHPDRDPSPFMDFLFAPPPRSRIARLVLRRWSLAWVYPDVVPGGSGWGYTRLRRLDPPPVERYAQRLTVSDNRVRTFATAALGDTADLAAMSPLTTALEDGDANVRGSAAAAIRRLRHAGAAAWLGGQPAETRLIGLLQDPKRRVRHVAAQSLVLLDRADAVRDAVSTADPLDAEAFGDFLKGKVKPLGQTWPGDTTQL